MRWRQTFMAEVFESLHQLGLGACPICGSAESLNISPFPVVLIDGDFSPEAEALTSGDARGDLTFAVRVECGTCGHLMLFTPRGSAAETKRSLRDGFATN